MTSTVRPFLHRTNVPRGAPITEGGAAKLGLPSSTALVVGSIIGTGVFTMPAVLAGAGKRSIITLGVITIGALLLGVTFGQLTRRVPNHEGGLYAYARHEFGEFAGYLTAWCHWVTCWAGNAAIVSSWVLYVQSLFGMENPSAWVSFGIALTAIPYFFSACAQFAYLVSRRRKVVGAALTRDLAIAVTGMLFSLWVTFASGYQSVYQAMVLVLFGIPLYGFLKARKERLGLVPEPVDMPEVPDRAHHAVVAVVR